MTADKRCADCRTYVPNDRLETTDEGSDACPLCGSTTLFGVITGVGDAHGVDARCNDCKAAFALAYAEDDGRGENYGELRCPECGNQSVDRACVDAP